MFSKYSGNAAHSTYQVMLVCSPVSWQIQLAILPCCQYWFQPKNDSSAILHIHGHSWPVAEKKKVLSVKYQTTNLMQIFFPLVTVLPALYALDANFQNSEMRLLSHWWGNNTIAQYFWEILGTTDGESCLMHLIKLGRMQSGQVCTL